jgi:hypothetical protein
MSNLSRPHYCRGRRWQPEGIADSQGVASTRLMLPSLGVAALQWRPVGFFVPLVRPWNRLEVAAR